MLDIASLRFIWWLLIGIIFMGFAITDGFDFGIAILFPFITRNEKEKLLTLNAIRPFWEGNQVWIILGAGALFAAWPLVYAVTFSALYAVILLLLLTMGISRPVSFKYREKIASQTWLNFWSAIIFLGGFIPTLIFGLLVGNVLQGIPFYFDNTLRVFYTGSFLSLINPFASWCALVSLAMLTMHGSVYLALKVEGPLYFRALKIARILAVVMIIGFLITGIWLAYGIVGYKVLGNIDHYGFSNPLHKEVVLQAGAWISNYQTYPILWVAPLLTFLGAFMVIVCAFRSLFLTFLGSSFCIIGIIASIGISMYPFILPSSSHLNSSLLVWDASSSELTLLMMLIAAIIFLPIILLYTGWVYRALGGKVKLDVHE